MPKDKKAAYIYCKTGYYNSVSVIVLRVTHCAVLTKQNVSVSWEQVEYKFTAFLLLSSFNL